MLFSFFFFLYFLFFFFIFFFKLFFFLEIFYYFFMGVYGCCVIAAAKFLADIRKRAVKILPHKIHGNLSGFNKLLSSCFFKKIFFRHFVKLGYFSYYMLRAQGFSWFLVFDQYFFDFRQA